MIRRLMRRVLSRTPYLKEVYRFIGLGHKVQSLERSLAYYDVRIDKIYKNVTILLARNDQLSAENAALRDEIERAATQRPPYLVDGETKIWLESESTLNPVPSDDELSTIFDDLENPVTLEYAKTHYYRWKETFERLPAEFSGTPGRVIELGAAPFYNRKLREIVPAREMIYVGKPFLNISEDFSGQFIDFNLEEDTWPIESESADAILAFELLEHFFQDPAFFFNEANRCLKAGGKLIISTPNIASWRSIRALITHFSPNFYVKFFPGHPLYFSHRTEYTHRDLNEFARCSGFSLRVDTFNSYAQNTESCLTQLFRECKWDTSNRGDTLFAVLTKVSAPTVRYPEWFYGNFGEAADLPSSGEKIA